MTAARRGTSCLPPCGCLREACSHAALLSTAAQFHFMRVGWRACCVSMQLDSKRAPTGGCSDPLSCPMQDHTQLSESMFETVVRQLRLQQRELELVRSTAEQVT